MSRPPGASEPQPYQYPGGAPQPGYPPPGGPPAPYHAPSAGQAPPPPRPPSAALRLGLGLPLLLAALIPTYLAYVAPTLRTFTMSRESGSSLIGDQEQVGWENFEHLFSKGDFFAGLLAASYVAAGAVVAGAVVAPLVAWCLHRAGSAIRTAARILWGLAAIAFAPAALALAWYTERLESGGFGEADVSDWTEPVSSWMGLVFGVVFGIGVLVALAAFRGGAEPVKPAGAVVTAAGLTAFALVAAALQTFTFNYVVGLPSLPNSFPLHQLYIEAFRLADFGLGAATAMLLLALLAVLGVGAALLFILTRTRIEVAPGPGEPRSFQVGAGIAGILLLLLLAAGVVFNLLPWLTRMTGGPDTGFDPTEVAIRTWGPPLTTTVIALGGALAGGFAIGALRPLGDGSRWLLLLFAPWLFVGSGPLSLANYEAVAEAEVVFTSAALAPRAWIAIPALFVFTALFWGLEERRRSMAALGAPASKANGAFVAGAWPLVALVGMAVWMANANDTIWQVLVSDPEQPTAVQALLWPFQTYAGRFDEIGIGLGYPIALLVLFAAAMVAAAIFYLPRVGIRVGRERSTRV